MAKIFSELLKECRSRGVGFIIADQSPARLFDDVASQPSIKVIFREAYPNNTIFSGDPFERQIFTQLENRLALVINGNIFLSMSIKEIEERLKNAIKNLFINQNDIFKFTSESGATEWNLVHHLAFEIQKEFPEYQHDIEITKHSFENRRPDIFLHKRGMHNNNFLVIEVKYQTNIQEDIDKIRDYWFKPPLSYTFGVAIRIDDPKNYSVEVLKNREKKSNLGKLI